MKSYIFKTKFAQDMKRNGEECTIVKDYNNGQVMINFLSDGSTPKVYDTELQEMLSKKRQSKIDAIIALHTNAVNKAKEAYKEAEHNCRENTFMDSGEADSYIRYVEGIEDIMKILGIPFDPNWDLDDDEDEEEE